MNEPRDEDLSIATTEDAEVVDALPVPAGAPAATAPPRATGASLLPAAPAAQAAVVAATGFAAGAATVAVVRARHRRKVAKRSRKARKQLGEVLGTRSFLVDIHLLGGRD
ncbi:MAG: hypothetical protein HZB46_07340 [Solirubrobacterales bacterium]|nr:hypothetical protein [Solirubrobacterales bacterium]